MTPEEARRLLEGTTPGPWKWRWDTGVLSVFDVEEEPVAIDLDVGDSDLIAAAPVLASMIAGMHTEYAIEHQHIPGGQWHQVTGWSHEPPLNDGHTLAADERIIRRYVTDEEAQMPLTDDQAEALTNEQRVLPVHRTEAGYPNCSTCDGGGCPDCTDPA